MPASHMGTGADHLEGFLELLEASGRSFLFGGESFRGLVRTLEPDTQRYDLSPNDDDTVQLMALRAAIPREAVRLGARLSDAEGYLYRVTRIRRAPNHLVVRLECALLQP